MLALLDLIVNGDVQGTAGLLSTELNVAFVIATPPRVAVKENVALALLLFALTFFFGPPVIAVSSASPESTVDSKLTLEIWFVPPPGTVSCQFTPTPLSWKTAGSALFG